MKVRNVGQWIAATLLLSLLVGCSDKNLGEVSGTVTLDGAPLPDATVMFTPLSGGRPAAAKTDAGGRYELVYDRVDSGAMLGEHVVEITTSQELTNDDDTVTMVEEKVPAKYNFNTELRATVEQGVNVFDFPLESAGEIVTEDEAVAEEDANEGGGGDNQ